MDFILLATFGIIYVIMNKFRPNEKNIIRKKLIKELRYSGRLSKKVDLLYIEIDKKNKEIKNSKDRSVELMEKFVRMSVKK